MSVEPEETAPTWSDAPLGRAPQLPGDLDEFAFKQLLRAQLFGEPAGSLRIGRFTVLRQLGVGGMGVVYAAYDEQLDRKVALKLLHGRHSPATEERRLLREAQALARLAHPNVVGVHEVGVYEGRVFLAMEFVHGQTAQAWRAAARRPLRELLDVYLQAGRGLAAAHAVGLVHGDFKPENVLVGDDGRVRVLDFGLARRSEADLERTDDARDPAARTVAPGDREADASVHVTATGRLAGTPAYMAPEQLAGARPDARSDQFSFCVALFEALYGRRPFAGTTLAELTAAVTAGRLVVPNERAVPGWLRRVVLRGLARAPDERWPSLPALLARLERQPRRARWFLGAGLVAGLAGAAGFLANPGPPRCSGAADGLAGVWDPERRAALQGAFLRIDRPFAAAAWERSEQLLDAHLQAWSAMQRSSCEATHVRGTQSSALLDLRSACLGRRLAEVRALTDLFAAADAQIVERAVEATSLLGSIDACADLEALTTAVPPPEDPALRARVQALRARLEPVIALHHTGNYRAAHPQARALAHEAAELGYPPVHAEALALAGELEEAAGQLAAAEATLHASVRAGALAGRDDLVARAWVRLVHVVGVEQARFADGLAWARVADVAVVRAGEAPLQRAALLLGEGDLLAERGDYDDALALHRRALALQEQALAADDPALAGSLDRIGHTLAARGDYPAAIAEHRRALQLREAALGPDHPDVALTQQRLAAALLRFGSHTEAAERDLRALEIVRDALPPDHPTAARLELEVGHDELNRDRFPEARVRFTTALRAFTRALGPDHPNLARAHIGLANVGFFLGEPAEGREHAARALEIFERAYGPEHPQVALALDVLAMTEAGLGRPEAALAHNQRALQIRTRRLPPDHPAIGQSHSNLANVLYTLGRRDETLAHDLEALRIAERRLGPDHRQLAQRHSNLALVLNEYGRHDEALAHYQRTLEICERSFGPDQPQVASALTSLAATLLKLTRPAEAVPLLERAMAIQTTGAADPRDIAFTHLTLGNALRATHRADKPTRARALAQVHRARDLYAELGPDSASFLADADRWLADPKIRGR